MKSKLHYALGLIFVGYSTLFGQIQIHEKDYTLQYFPDHLSIHFLDAVAAQSVSVEDAYSATPIRFERTSNPLEINLTQLQPSQIFKIIFRDNQQQLQTNYIANSSISSGSIEVYFNHSVATAFAQSQAALNLGNLLDEKLITYINECQHDLSIAIYNSYSPSASAGIAGAINAAYDRGVKVRLIYDGSTSSVMIPLLNPLIPILPSPSSSSYGIMHNKFVVFDAESSDPNQPFVWTGSTNWTASQIDGPDRNNAIVIQDQALALAYKMEFDEMWGSSSMVPDLVNSKFGPYKSDNTPHHFVVGNKVIDSYFSPSDGTTAKIMDAINSADTDLEIATMLITRTDVKNTLLSKYNAGLTNINLLVDSQNPSGNQISAIQAGLTPGHASVFTLSGIMHHKFMVADNFNHASDPLVLTGSHNWSTSAETKNDENTLIVHDANIANQYFQAFADLYQQAGGNMEYLGVQASSANANLCAIYPNPTTGNITVKWDQTLSTAVKINIYSLLGKAVFTQQFNNSTFATLSITDLESGIYFVSVETTQGKEIFKLIKK